MSIKAVNQFLTKVNQDEKLQAELSQVMKSQNDCQAAVELAAKHGYEFTLKELGSQTEQLETIKAKQSADRELNESDLESITGGHSLPPVPHDFSAFNVDFSKLFKPNE